MSVTFCFVLAQNFSQVSQVKGSLDGSVLKLGFGVLTETAKTLETLLAHLDQRLTPVARALRPEPFPGGRLFGLLIDVGLNDIPFGALGLQIVRAEEGMVEHVVFRVESFQVEGVQARCAPLLLQLVLEPLLLHSLEQLNARLGSTLELLLRHPDRVVHF